jgi:uncharacterized YigZ family protein
MASGRTLLRRHRFASAAFLHVLPSPSIASTTTGDVVASSWSSSLVKRPPGRVVVGRNAKYATERRSTRLCHSKSIKWTIDGTDFHEAGDEGEVIVKKSRFLGYAAHCASYEEARTMLDRLRSDHPRCRHVCHGYVSSTNGHTERSSDDGEPSGTGGHPILGAIRSEGLTDVLCAVVRYYGGIKLGTGGLIRAYGNAARNALRRANAVVLTTRTCMRVSTRVANIGALLNAVYGRDGTKIIDEVYYGHDGTAEVTIGYNEEDGEMLMEDIADATRGDVKFL